jgi:WD40 repeat protein
MTATNRSTASDKEEKNYDGQPSDEKDGNEKKEKENEEEKAEQNEDEEAAEVFDKTNVYRYAPHSRPVSTLVFSKVDHSTLYTSSYDGSVRAMDLEKQVFSEVFVDADERSQTAMCASGRTLYTGNSAGGVTVLDTRTANKKAKPTVLHDKKKKVGTVDICPANAHLLLTCSNDMTVGLFDARKLKDALARGAHTKSVNSAYWSSSGSRVLSTCKDNLLRVWGGHTAEEDPSSWDWKSPLKIKHNNQTGRWVTPFRAAVASCANFGYVRYRKYEQRLGCVYAHEWR